MVRLWFVMGNLAEDSEKFRCSMLPNDRAVHKMGKLFSRTVAKVFEEDVQVSSGLAPRLSKTTSFWEYW